MYEQIEVDQKLIQKLKEVEKILKIEIDGIKRLTKSVEEAFGSYQKNQSENALNGIEKALNSYKLEKSKCLSIVGAEDVSLSLINKVLETQQMTKEVCYERGKHHFYNGNLQLALIDFNHNILVHPNDQRVQKFICCIKKIQLTEDFSCDTIEKKMYRKALQTLTFGFPLVTKNDKITTGMYYERALVSIAAGYLPQALSDATEAIKMKPNFLKAIVMRAKIFFTIRGYHRCLIDCARAQKIQPSESITMLQNYCSEKVQGHEEIRDVYLTPDSITTSSNTNNLHNIFARINTLTDPANAPSVQELPIEVRDPKLLHYIPYNIYKIQPLTITTITPGLASWNSTKQQKHHHQTTSQ